MKRAKKNMHTSLRPLNSGTFRLKVKTAKSISNVISILLSFKQSECTFDNKYFNDGITQLT